MASINSKICKALAFLSIIATLFPTAAYAEPRYSGLHTLLLWLAVVIGAVLFAIVPLLIKKLIKPRRGGWVFWLVSIVLGLFFLIILGPIIVGLGSILISGRTM